MSKGFQHGILHEQSRALRAEGMAGVAVKCIGGLQKHQQFRQDGNAPTLTGAMGSGGGQTPICAIWSEKYQCYLAIRRLTPRECFRLQGWTDDYFDKAQAFNSDSQLYKQAGNGITVNVAEEIGKKIKEIERSNNETQTRTF